MRIKSKCFMKKKGFDEVDSRGPKLALHQMRLRQILRCTFCRFAFSG